MPKRTLDSFFQLPAKKTKLEHTKEDVDRASGPEEQSQDPPSSHTTYPFPVPDLTSDVINALQYLPAPDQRHINDRPNLDLLYFEPFIDRKTANALFRFLRGELFFYRVQYKIKRGPVETQINTPRYTTVFGVDQTSTWIRPSPDKELTLVETSSQRPVAPKKYRCQPRPIPKCLEYLQRATEAVTGESFNFCLVNFYCSGQDSISYHSDDERFLGNHPAIASFSLGDKRDFLMKPKPSPGASGPKASETAGTQGTEKPLKLKLGSGDMVLMKGATQSNWLHSIPKRSAPGGGGRINVTFRKALVREGTENYYHYNVGTGVAHKWSDAHHKMVTL